MYISQFTLVFSVLLYSTSKNIILATCGGIVPPLCVAGYFIFNSRDSSLIENIKIQKTINDVN